MQLSGARRSSLEILFRTRRRFKGGFGWQKTRAHSSLARVPTKATSFAKVSFFCHSAKSHAPPGLFALPLERKFAPRASSGRFAEEPSERARTESISGKTTTKQSTPLRLSPVPELRGRAVAIGSGKPLSLQSPAPSAIPGTGTGTEQAQISWFQLYGAGQGPWGR